MSSKTNSVPFVHSVFHLTDFSPASNLAFAYALAIALIRETRFEILNAQARGSADWTRFLGVRETLERWGLLEPGSPRAAVFAKLKMSVRKIAAKGSPARETIEHVNSTRPDLVVLATNGRQGIAGWLRPSVAQKIGRRSSSMTLFVPAEARGFVNPENGRIKLERILVPVDREPDPSESLVRATRVANLLGDDQVDIQLLNVNGNHFPSPDRFRG